MSNEDTVNAIIANLEAILKKLDLKFEELASDPDMDIDPVCQILYGGEDFEYAHKEKPLYNDIKFVIRIVFRNKTPDESRKSQIKWIHKLRDNIDINVLNVGALEDSKLVSKVLHGGGEVTYEPPVTSTDYILEVRYREL